jgi:hypothetical protein
MPNVKVKPIGYCVVRQPVHIDNYTLSNVITGVFGVFDTINKAEEFIFSVTDGTIRHTKTEHHYTDDEHYWTIHGIRTPMTKHHLAHLAKATQYAVMLSEGNVHRYLSKKFFDKVLSGDPIDTFPPSYFQADIHAVDDHALAVEAMNQAKNTLHKHPKVEFKVISF